MLSSYEFIDDWLDVELYVCVNVANKEKQKKTASMHNSLTNVVKEEPPNSSDDEGLTEANAVLEVHPDDICYSQPTASRRFKDGRLVETLIDELTRGAVDPLAHPLLLGDLVTTGLMMGCMYVLMLRTKRNKNNSAGDALTCLET